MATCFLVPILKDGLYILIITPLLLLYQLVKTLKRPPGITTCCNCMRVFIPAQAWATNLPEWTPRSKWKHFIKERKPQAGFASLGIIWEGKGRTSFKYDNVGQILRQNRAAGKKPFWPGKRNLCYQKLVYFYNWPQMYGSTSLPFSHG